METPVNCPECGAPDNACQLRFDECLVKEFEDSRYGKVHNLTVSTYMLQHSSKLTRAGWLYERELLREFLTGTQSPEQIRKEKKDVVDSGKRTFKIQSRDGLPVIPHLDWSKTILDVCLDDPEQYCEDVRAWARAVLTDSETIGVQAS